MKQAYQLIFAILFFTTLVLLIIGITNNASNKMFQCSKVIFLKGELSRDISHVDYLSNSNIVKIHYCDGTTEIVHTSHIIKIVTKE